MSDTPVTSTEPQQPALPAQPAQPFVRRMVLTSVNQVLVLVNRNPILAEKMPRFAGLVNAPLSTAPKKSCNCGAKQNITTPDATKQLAENLLSSLTKEDFLQMKSILELDELCYYTRTANQNKLELICV
jgi:hypothetical protein